MTNATLEALLNIYGTVLKAGWGESPDDANEQESSSPGEAVEVSGIGELVAKASDQGTLHVTGGGGLVGTLLAKAHGQSGNYVIMKTDNPKVLVLKPRRVISPEAIQAESDIFLVEE
jgi:hypothetical protein